MEISSKDVFKILIKENADMLLAFIRCYERNSAAVDDAFQETLLIAWQKLAEYDNEKPFAPWLRGIAFNVVRSEKRKYRKEKTTSEEAIFTNLDIRFRQLQVRSVDTFEEKVHALRECLARLPADFHRPIELHYQQELGVKLIAQKLGISLELVKKRLQRARKQLLNCLLGKLPELS